MRKIEQQMIQAIRAGQTAKFDNTTIRHNNGIAEVYLHGNAIACISDKSVSYSLAGWNTVTTRSRIRALMSAFGGDGCYTKHGVPFIHGMAVESTDWVTFNPKYGVVVINSK